MRETGLNKELPQRYDPERQPAPAAGTRHHVAANAAGVNNKAHQL
jgi:hypothetical protein